MPLAKINLQFGGAGIPTTFGTWTNLTSITVTATTPILNYADAVDTGWDITVNDAPDASGNTGVSAVGTGDAAWVDQAVVSERFHAVAAAGDDLGIYRLSGLDNAKAYNIKVFASRDAADSNRRGEYSVDAFSTFQTVDASENSTDIASFASVAPSSGIIDVSFRSVSGSNFGYINAIEIEEVAGAPAGNPWNYYAQQ